MRITMMIDEITHALKTFASFPPQVSAELDVRFRPVVVFLGSGHHRVREHRGMALSFRRPRPRKKNPSSSRVERVALPVRTIRFDHVDAARAAAGLNDLSLPASTAIRLPFLGLSAADDVQF